MNSIGTIYFEEKRIKVYKTPDRTIDKLCINDLCSILKRHAFLEDGTAIRQCPAAMILDDTHPQDLYTDFNEAIAFIRWMCAESKILSLTGRRLLTFLQRSRIGSNTHIANGTEEQFPSEEVVNLEYSGNKFTMRTVDGRYMVNATEMARPFEKRPAVWLKTIEAARLRQELVNNGVCSSLESQVIATRGSQGATWLEIHLWVQFAQWLSPAFASWCSKKIISLMRDGEVPLGDEAEGVPDPDSHQHDDEATEHMQPPLPDSFQSALTLIASQHTTIRKQRDLIRYNRHKWEHYDETIESRTWFSTTMIAHELNLTAIQLNLFLMEQNIQRKIDGVWVVNREYGHLRNVHYYEWYNHRTRYTNKYKMEGWTHQGREYILELWKKING